MKASARSATPRSRISTHGLLAAALIAGGGAAAGAQEVTLTRIIGEGDTLPNGWPWGGGGLASIDGDRIAFIGATSEGDAICIHEIATGEFRLLADTTMRSPTYPDFDFKSLSNPAISGDDVVFPGAALLFTGEWEGLYHVPAGGGPISVVVDELHPEVRIPSLPVLSEAGVLYRDRGYAGEPIAFSTLSGDYQQVAFRGDPAPGGGTFFDMEPPAIGGALGAFRAMVTYPTANLRGAYAWRADTGEHFLIARQNDPIPGRPGVFAVVFADDSDGQQVLVTGWDGAFPDNYEGVYTWRGAGLELLVEDGDPIPEGGGAIFRRVDGVAIDGDSMIFIGEDTTGDIIGLYGIFDGHMAKILENGDVLEGAPIWNFNITARALSGNRVVINVGLDRLGGDAIYLAEFNSGCRADLDGDGELTFFDFLAFQNLFAAGDLRADFTGDGVLDFFDFLAFQNEFAAGCP